MTAPLGPLPGATPRGGPATSLPGVQADTEGLRFADLLAQLTARDNPEQRPPVDAIPEGGHSPGLRLSVDPVAQDSQLPVLPHTSDPVPHPAVAAQRSAASVGDDAMLGGTPEPSSPYPDREAQAGGARSTPHIPAEPRPGGPAFAESRSDQAQAPRAMLDDPTPVAVPIPLPPSAAVALAAKEPSFLGKEFSGPGSAALPEAVAEIFNEHGLMQGYDGPPLIAPGPAIAVPARSPVAAGAQAARIGASLSVQGGSRSPLAVRQTGSPAAPQDKFELPLSPFPAVSGRGHAPGARPLHGRAARLAAASGSGPSPVTARAPIRTTGRAESADRGAAVSRRLLHALELLRQAQSTEVRLAVEVVEQGLRLIAWTEKMNREDREKLRSEMARLAASHGFSTAEISVNDRADVAPSGRGKEG